MTPMGVDVLWNPHLGRDVRCVRRRVIEILNKFFLGHLIKLSSIYLWNDISNEYNDVRFGLESLDVIWIVSYVQLIGIR